MHHSSDAETFTNRALPSAGVKHRLHNMLYLYQYYLFKFVNQKRHLRIGRFVSAGGVFAREQPYHTNQDLFNDARQPSTHLASSIKVFQQSARPVNQSKEYDEHFRMIAP